ncbi:unnamed protein product [Thelazia callipaeda]|uniref:Protein YIPF n=1 Tax=Thelazia callipaeda TaxID=103827 RepID=A0A0N5D9H9_THECL|nr:unnamed protein product [Thelazia callipaeda]
MSHYWMDGGNEQNTWYSNQANAGYEQFDYSQQQTSPLYGPTFHSEQQQQHMQNMYNNQFFIPSQSEIQCKNSLETEPPLLEELGINFSHIRQKTFAVLNPAGSVAPDVIADQDLAGPLVFCLLFGAALLLHGKVRLSHFNKAPHMHFGYIYGIGALGCIGMYALLNLMAEDRSISFTCTASVLGYCLLPMAIVSIVAVVLSFQGIVGYLIAGAAVIWCSVASSKLFVTTLSLNGQRLLVAYPCALLYCVFALLAIF